MGTPEEKARKRMRIRSKVTRDLHSPKYRQRIKDESTNKKRPVHDVSKLTHADLVKLINSGNDLDE